MRVFISGNIDLDEALYNFQQVENKLRKIGVTDIFNPMVEITAKLQWTQRLEICLAEVAKCDFVIFQNNWLDSIDARWEFTEANRLKKAIRMDNPTDYADIGNCIRKTHLIPAQ